MYLFTGVSKPQAYFSVPVCHVERMEYLKIAFKAVVKQPEGEKKHYFEYAGLQRG